MMKNQLFILFLFCSFLLSGQNMSPDSLSSTDSLFEKKSLEEIETTKKSKESLLDFFSKQDVLEITLVADFDTLLKNKKNLVEVIPTKVSFLDPQNEKTTLKASIRPRGKFRRKICAFPPLRLKFKKKGLRKLGLNDEFNSFKLVTHCLDSSKKSKNNIFKEYLLYQIYQLHSEHSLRAQLVHVTYVQRGTKKTLFKRYGIILEGDKELAYRCDASVVEKFNISPDSLTTFGSSVHSIFQCMIGNADWDIVGMRNVKLMRIKDAEKLTIFPYDFDFSGFVNASYAIANPNFDLTSTRQRVYLGEIYSEEEMKKVAHHFINKKVATLELCKNFKLLSKRNRKDIVRYLKSFYKIIENEKSFTKKLAKLCPKK